MVEHSQPRLQQALASWPHWATTLPAEPRVLSTLHSGRSHNTYLLAADQQQFVLRLENPRSRELAMSQTQEVAVMQAAGPLAPPLVWSDQHTLVTGFVHGSRWQPLENLPALCAALHHLHGQTLDLPAFDLARHCDNYWQKILHSGAPLSAETHALFDQSRTVLSRVLQDHPEQVVCHNDLNADNIFCRDNDFVFLDWEYAGYNSPYFELATLAEFFHLSDPQSAQLSAHYWKNSHATHHLAALQAFRVAVRFTEWLWLILKQDHQLAACELRLKKLLKENVSA